MSDEEPPKRKCCSNPLIAAFSNLSTAFNLVNISIAHVIMENQYCGGDNCPTAVSAASTAVLVGAIAGQLTFGYVGDCIGRSRALQLTMALSIFGALVSAFAVPLSSTDPSSVFTFLILSRLVLGVGVGGVVRRGGAMGVACLPLNFTPHACDTPPPTHSVESHPRNPLLVTRDP